MPATAYNLPSTHELNLDTDDEALADFSIALIGLLDTLYRVHVRLGGSVADTRAEQAAVLADAHRIPLPDWAQVHTINNKDVSRLSTLRNGFFHEGRYEGSP